MPSPALLHAPIPEGVWPLRRGKVRDVFDLGDRLLMVSTDRISAFDWIMPQGVPDKGRVLTQLSAFWFQNLPVAHHMLSLDLETLELPPGADRAALAGRSMIVRKASVAPIECVVRGYLEGSGWLEYQRTGSVCGVPLPPGLVRCSQLPEPIFTPATKAETGHDENITFETMQQIVGAETADVLRRKSLELYQQGAVFAAERGVLIADTKFEWGEAEGEWILVDEALTPDSSRFWPADDYQPGRPQASFDKQFVRDWLNGTDWDKNSPPPSLPPEVIARTREKYLEAYERIVGKALPANSTR